MPKCNSVLRWPGSFRAIKPTGQRKSLRSATAKAYPDTAKRAGDGIYWLLLRFILSACPAISRFVGLP